MSGGRGTSFYYFENTGDDDAPAYAAVQNNPFGLINIPNNPSGSSDSDSFPTFVDSDGDGDMDIISGDTYGDFHYYENTGSSSVPQFANPVKDPFGLTDEITFSSYPTFGDIDNDGDLDLLSGAARSSSGNPVFYYFENTGSSTAPQFSAPISNPFGLTLSTPYIRIQLGDLDSDGDLDIMIGGSGGNFRYFQNGPSPSYTQIPDAKFEQALIDRNIDTDGIINGRALTSDLEIVTGLVTVGLEIEDFTGIEAFRDLEVLNIYNNFNTSIDLSGNGKLRELYASNETKDSETLLNSLDVSNNPLLEKLEVLNNNISTLDLSNNPLLTEINVGGNNLTSLDVSNQTAILELNFVSNAISTIDVSQNTALTFLQGNDNGLSTLDVSLNTNLTSLAVNQNPELGSFSTAANLSLVYLNVADTGISSIDVSANTALTELFVGSNSLTSIDVSNNLLLKRLGVAFNQITNIDVSANNKLISFRAENNALVSLNIKNSANNLIPSTFIAFDIRNNPALECVLVDNATAATANWGVKDAGTTFSDTICYSASNYT
ncbi:Repeat domain-containing protein [Polaribacter sp. KT25b]|uniref:FG-GAP-like repeat-containing protein n=1 Tax=Polaribacter sp. KT25b TaxID=1855336 RepID=UPI00087B6E40|nr:Repeat domain-containing protein [Polaribacter sp. KT25b]